MYTVKIFQPHKRVARGATLHRIYASVAGVQSCRARLTPRLIDAEPQWKADRHTERQTVRQADRQTAVNILCNISIAAYYGGKCAERKRVERPRECVSTYLKHTKKCVLMANPNF